MALYSIDQPVRATPLGWAPFGLGFRPFFHGAGAFAVLLMALWLATLGGFYAPPTADATLWHAHEMLFGFAGAVIAGFLLTAVQNWTGVPMTRGLPLAVLFGVWLAARVAFLLPGAQPLLVAGIDLAFLPIVGVLVMRPIVKVGQQRNAPFPLMLLGLTVANALTHAEFAGLAQHTAHAGLVLGLMLVVLMMVAMGGRVIPYFTDNRVQGRARRWTVVEWLAPLSVLAVGAVWLTMQEGAVLATAAAVAALANGVRLAGWQNRRLWTVPLLWVLHLGYGWIVAGFALLALSALAVLPQSLAVHAFTVGAMGGLILGMMARVSLGHTGRRLEASAVMAWAFATLNLAALVRVGLPLAAPAAAPLAWQLSGGLWVVAYLVFAVVYTPVLLRARVDGKPG
ncbi:MAG: NnrS family protein [Thiobacillus sp.]|nr:NnrS family protein [Thiobacillus sp.]